MPVAFLINCQRNQASLEMYYQFITEKIPNLKKKTFIIVTDREKESGNAINKFMPTSNHFYCWNNITNDVKWWLKEHGAPLMILVFI